MSNFVTAEKKIRGKRKKIVMASLCALLAFMLVACGENKEETIASNDAPAEGAVSTSEAATGEASVDIDYETLTIRYFGGSGSVGVDELAEALGYLEPIKLSFEGTTTGGPESIQAMLTDNIDTALCATNGIINADLASEFNVLGVAPGLGSDDSSFTAILVNDDSQIKTAKDLIGKKVGVNTFGALYEAFTKTYLQDAGLSQEAIDQVELVVVPPAEAEQILVSKQIDAVVLGGVGVQVAIANEKIRILVKDTDVWGPYQQSLIVVRRDWAEKNPNSAKKFVEALAKTYEYVKETPIEEVRDLMRNIIEERARNESTDLIKYFNGYGIQSEGGIVEEKDVQFWIDYMVSQGQLEEGQVTTSQVYTNEYNPFYK